MNPAQSRRERHERAGRMSATDAELRAHRDSLDDALWDNGERMSAAEFGEKTAELRRIEDELRNRRKAELQGRSTKFDRDECPFCNYAGPNTILWEDAFTYVVEPLRPITPGHVLVIPKEHAEDFTKDAGLTAGLFMSVTDYVNDGPPADYNLITSKGEAASQTVKHLHVHVLPRTWGDEVRLPWRNPNKSPLKRSVN